MEFSEYENIEIFNKTQSFGINKCKNQALRQCEANKMIMNPIQKDDIGLSFIF
jgi:hypothetical protein